MIPPGLHHLGPRLGHRQDHADAGASGGVSRAGLTVQPFKSGPDYIDPAFHRAASGRASFNLDSWAMGADRIAGLCRRREGADLILAEGSMGLFDGVARRRGGRHRRERRYRGADRLAGGAGARRVGAGAVGGGGGAGLRHDAAGRGDCRRDPEPGRQPPARGAGARRAWRRRASAFSAPCRARPTIEMPERHLGLVQAEETPDLDRIIAEAGDFVAAHVDLDGAARRGAGRRRWPRTPAPAGHAARPAHRAGPRLRRFPSSIRISSTAGARAGAEILPFSPLADEGARMTAPIAAGCRAAIRNCTAPQLGRCQHGFAQGLRRFAETRPVHGECGGYMAMGAALIDREGQRHEMAGLLGLVTTFEKRKMHLGYRLAELGAPMPGHAAGRAAARARVSLLDHPRPTRYGAGAGGRCQRRHRCPRPARAGAMPRAPSFT